MDCGGNCVPKCCLCGYCIRKHCQCGLLFCRESRPCNCLTSSRCMDCKGCQRPYGGHCKCESHTKISKKKRLNPKTKCICSPEICMFENEKMSEQYRKIGLPTVENIYSQNSRRKCPLPAYDIFSTILAKNTDNIDHSSKKSHTPYGLRGITYEEAISKTSLCLSGTQQREEILDQALKESQDYEAMTRIKPNEDIIDYIIYIASIKSCEIPELIGTLDDGAAVATGIVVEEYIRQIVEEYFEKKQSLINDPVEKFSDEALEIHLHNLFNGVNVSSITVEEIEDNLHLIFGRDMPNCRPLIDEKIKQLQHQLEEQRNLIITNKNSTQSSKELATCSNEMEKKDIINTEQQQPKDTKIRIKSEPISSTSSNKTSSILCNKGVDKLDGMDEKNDWISSNVYPGVYYRLKDEFHRPEYAALYKTIVSEEGKKETSWFVKRHATAESAKNMLEFFTTLVSTTSQNQNC